MKLRLYTKYSVALIALLVVLTCAVGGVLLYRFHRSVGELTVASDVQVAENLMAQVTKRAEAVTRFLAIELAGPIAREEAESIRDLLLVVQGQEDLQAVVVYGLDREVLYVDGEPAAGGQLLNDIEALQTLAGPQQFIQHINGDSLYAWASVRVEDQVVAGVKVTVSLSGVRADLKAMTDRLKQIGAEGRRSGLIEVVLTATGLIFFSALMVLVVTGRLLEPVRRVADLANRVGKGDFASQIDLKRNDELGELVDRFNEMSAALRRTTVSKQHVEAIIGSMADGLLVVDQEGRTTLVNRALRRLIGQRETDLVGRPLVELFQGEKKQVLHEWLRRLQAGESVESLELDLRGGRGETTPVALSGSHLGPVSGGEHEVVCVIQDIGLQLQSQRQLQTAKEEAEAASRAKSAFLATMSHEIRTPINGVIGMTELLESTPLSSRQRHFARSIRRSGTALLEIINNILDFSKIEAGKFDLEKIDFNLHELIEETLDLFAERAARRQLELVSLVDSEVPLKIRADLARVRQILMNLLSNAVKFTERGTVAVRVFCREHAAGGVELRFEVRDTGIGISPESHDKILTAFSQADQSTARQYGGTGLGLAISRRLVEIMGGKFGLESAVGKGSTFWFTLVPERPQGGWRRRPAAAPEIRKLKVLILEGAGVGKDHLERLLSEIGVKIGSATSSPEVMEKLLFAAGGGEPYDVVVLDTVTPQLGGWMLAQQIRSDTRLESVHLVRLTTVQELEETKTAAEGLFDAQLLKPVYRTKLERSLAEAVSLSDGRQTAQRSELLSRLEDLRRHPVRVLLAEDNAVNLEVGKNLLKSFGCHVDEVVNGQEAIEAFAVNPYDLVFMDWQMPVIDGIEATRRIRDLEAQRTNGGMPRTPVVALTAHALKGDREKCLAAGMDDYMAKPFTRKVLGELLRKWTNRDGRKGKRVDRPSASGPSMGAAEALQQSVLDDLREVEKEGVPGLLSSLIDTYLSDSPKLLNRLMSAASDKDAEELNRAAHSFKSSSATLGAMNLSGLCAALEAKAREGEIADAASRVAAIVEEFEAVKEGLDAERQRNGVAS